MPATRLYTTPAAPVNPTSTVMAGVVALKYKCLVVDAHLPSNNDLEGSILFKTKDNLDAYLLDAQTSAERHIPVNNGCYLAQFDVSPNWKMLLYISGNKQVISNVEGQVIWSKPANNRAYIGWITNTYGTSCFQKMVTHTSIY